MPDQITPPNARIRRALDNVAVNEITRDLFQQHNADKYEKLIDKQLDALAASQATPAI